MQSVVITVAIEIALLGGGRGQRSLLLSRPRAVKARIYAVDNENRVSKASSGTLARAFPSREKKALRGVVAGGGADRRRRGRRFRGGEAASAEGQRAEAG